MEASQHEKPFLRRPHPEADESMLGFLSRVAAANGYAGPIWLLRLIGYKPSLLSSSTDLEPLAVKLGVSVRILERMCHWPTRREGRHRLRRFGEAELPPALINTHRPRLCPYCVRTGAYRRQLWGASLIACCPKHKCLLIDRCPQCSSPFTWQKTRTAHCHACNASLSETVAPAAPEGALQLTQLLASRICNKHSSVEGDWQIVEHLSPSDLCRLILLLGTYSLPGARGAGYRKAQCLTAQATAKLVEAAAITLASWPENMKAFFRKLCLQRPLERTGLAVERGSFYEAFAKEFRGEQFAFLRTAFAEFLEEEWQGGFLSRKNSRTGADMDNAARIPAATAARELKRTRGTVMRLIEDGTLKGHTRPMGQRSLALVDRRSLTGLEARLDDELCAEDTARFLRISEKPLQALVTAGYITPMPWRPINRSRSVVYSRQALQAFLDGLYAHCSDRNAKEQIGFDQTIRTLTVIGQGIVDLIDHIFAGRLVPSLSRSRENGLWKLGFDADAVRSLVTAADNGDWLTLPEAACLLNLKQEVFYGLINAEKIPCERRPWRTREIRMVRREDLLRFRERFVPATELASKAHTSPAHIIRQLEAAGVAPAIGPAADGNRQVFFRKKNVGNVAAKLSALRPQ
jgi:hypothetical protein